MYICVYIYLILASAPVSFNTKYERVLIPLHKEAAYSLLIYSSFSKIDVPVLTTLDSEFACKIT